MSPLALLKRVAKVASGVAKERVRELRAELEREVVKLKGGGQGTTESLGALLRKWKGLFSRPAQLGCLVPDGQQVGQLFVSVNKAKYSELVQHYAAMIRKKPDG